MSNITISELINTKAMEGKIYQMLETAMIVSEQFLNLYRADKLDQDYVYGECESDTYANLIDMALEIESQNTNETPLYMEDIREKAEELILKEYGIKEPKTYLVIEVEPRSNGDNAKVIGQFDNKKDAEDLMNKENSTRRWIIEQ